MNNLAAKYSFRPSSLLELPYNSWEAYIFDAQCYIAGVEAEEKATEGDKKETTEERPTITENGNNISAWKALAGDEIRVISDPNFNGIW